MRSITPDDEQELDVVSQDEVKHFVFVPLQPPASASKDRAALVLDPADNRRRKHDLEREWVALRDGCASVGACVGIEYPLITGGMLAS